MKKKKLIKVSTVPMSLNTFCRGQLAMLSEHFEVVAISSPGEQLLELGDREGVRTVAVPMERHIAILKDLMSLIRMILVFLRERPDIVHSMTPKAGLISMLAAWICRVPVRMHTYTGLVFPTESGLKQKILIWMEKLLCFCATYINPESHGVAKDLKAYHITESPLHIIANGNVRGIDLSYYALTPKVLENAQKLKDNSLFTFVYVGRLVSDKGINELVEAFCKLRKEISAVRLLLVGRYETILDPLADDTLERIEGESAIIFCGSQSDVRPYYAAANALVFPSYREGMPNVVLEAGAMGLPAIVTDINGSNEIIVNGENGIIIPPKNSNSLYQAMLSFVDNVGDVRRMAGNARRMIALRYEQRMIWDALLTEYNKQIEIENV